MKYLVCDICNRKCYLLDRKGNTCGMKRGDYCKGILVEPDPSSLPIDIDPDFLVCNICDRLCFDMGLEGHTCQIRNPGGNKCAGELVVPADKTLYNVNKDQFTFRKVE